VNLVAQQVVVVTIQIQFQFCCFRCVSMTLVYKICFYINFINYQKLQYMQMTILPQSMGNMAVRSLYSGDGEQLVWRALPACVFMSLRCHALGLEVGGSHLIDG